MRPEERLDAILAGQAQFGFPPFSRPPTGAAPNPPGPCVCYSESPPDHLAHLIVDRCFQPWGIVITREQMLKAGGGAVAYVPDTVYSTLYQAGLAAWAVRTSSGSQWMHEREWLRVPETPSMAYDLQILANGR